MFFVQLLVFICIMGILLLIINTSASKFKFDKTIISYGLVLIIGGLILVSSLNENNFKQLSLLSAVAFGLFVYALANLIRIIINKKNSA